MLGSNNWKDLSVIKKIIMMMRWWQTPQDVFKKKKSGCLNIQSPPPPLWCLRLCAVLRLGCIIAEIPLNIFIGHINGRLMCLSVNRKWELALFFDNQCDLLLKKKKKISTITKHYLCDFLVFMICQLLRAQTIIASVLGKAAIFHHRPGFE